MYGARHAARTWPGSASSGQPHVQKQHIECRLSQVAQQAGPRCWPPHVHSGGVGTACACWSPCTAQGFRDWSIPALQGPWTCAPAAAVEGQLRDCAVVRSKVHGGRGCRGRTDLGCAPDLHGATASGFSVQGLSPHCPRLATAFSLLKRQTCAQLRALIDARRRPVAHQPASASSAWRSSCSCALQGLAAREAWAGQVRRASYPQPCTLSLHPT